MKKQIKIIINSIILIIVIILSLVAVKYSLTLFLFIWFIFIIFLLIKSKKDFIIIIFFNIGILIMLLTSLSFYQEYKTYYYTKEHFTNSFNLKNRYNFCCNPNEYYGWLPVPGITINHKKYFGKNVIYNAVYTFDNNGLRISPPCNENCRKSILFFGCSMTFGTGIQDNETYPYQVGIKENNNYKILNFGFPGYGAQQMLMQIKKGITEKNNDKKYKPANAFFMSISDHVNRISGTAHWMRGGPKIIKDNNGNLIFYGTIYEYIENHNKKKYINSPTVIKIISPVIHFITNLFSNLFDKIKYSNRAIFDKKNLNEDIELYTDIIKESEKLLKQKYPEIEFVVLFRNWGEKNADYITEEVIRQFKKKNIHYDIFKEKIHGVQIWNIKHDGHSTPQLNEKIAEYITKKYLK